MGKPNRPNDRLPDIRHLPPGTDKVLAELAENAGIDLAAVELPAVKEEEAPPVATTLRGQTIRQVDHDNVVRRIEREINGRQGIGWGDVDDDILADIRHALRKVLVSAYGE